MMDKRSFLLLKPPQNNDKKEDAADSFFTQISEILKGKKINLSAEIAIYGKFLWFFLTCPSYIKDAIKGQWNSYYPKGEILEVKDYTEKLFFGYQPKYLIGCEMYYDQGELFPLQTYKDLKKNPLYQLLLIKPYY